MDLMTIGTFAERTRLSPKALRLYEKLALLEPVHVEESTGYRFYSEDQVDVARLVGLLRRLDMSLAVIGEVLTLAPEERADAVGTYWAEVESMTADRRALVSYIQARLRGADMTTYDIQIRHIPERRILAIGRHLFAKETDQFFDEAFARLRHAATGLTGIEGCPFLVFYGEVSDDSDGPIELCRPVASDATVSDDSLQLRVEAAHDEVYVRLAQDQMSWPVMAPVVDAIEGWVGANRRLPAGPLRQVLIADQRSAGPATGVCDLSVPLK